MYRHIGDETIEAKVAVVGESPAWIDMAENSLCKQYVFGCKIILDVTRPYICFAMSKFGSNITQKGDSNVGGQLQLCEQGKTSKQKISAKDKHYTVLGLANL